MERRTNMFRKRKKKKYLKHQKRFLMLIFLFLVLCLSFLVISLESYLYDLQRIERLSKVKDYNDYNLTYTTQNRCEKKKRFTVDNITYVYDCLDNVYLSYGSTKVTLEEILTKKYLTLNDLKKNMKYDSSDEVYETYVYYPTKNKIGYKLSIDELEDENVIVTIAKFEMS